MRSFKKFCWARDLVASLISKLDRMVCFMSCRSVWARFLLSRVSQLLLILTETVRVTLQSTATVHGLFCTPPMAE